jgi:dynein heavy chain, axonemal
MFCDFWEGRDTEPRHYMEVPNQNKLMEKIYEYQDEYNADPRYSGSRGKNALKLVLFQDACEHICRIVRVLRQPRGNCLLLGVGGSGRQSLAKISAFIANQALVGIELIKNYGLKSWREDLKRILMGCGLESKPTMFLFAESQIIHEQMLEDINSVLNSGDVTGLYP